MCVISLTVALLYKAHKTFGGDNNIVHNNASDKEEQRRRNMQRAVTRATLLVTVCFCLTWVIPNTVVTFAIILSGKGLLRHEGCRE